MSKFRNPVIELPKKVVGTTNYVAVPRQTISLNDWGAIYERPELTFPTERVTEPL